MPWNFKWGAPHAFSWSRRLLFLAPKQHSIFTVNNDNCLLNPHRDRKKKYAEPKIKIDKRNLALQAVAFCAHSPSSNSYPTSFSFCPESSEELVCAKDCIDGWGVSTLILSIDFYPLHNCPQAATRMRVNFVPLRHSTTMFPCLQLIRILTYFQHPHVHVDGTGTHASPCTSVELRIVQS